MFPLFAILYKWTITVYQKVLHKFLSAFGHVIQKTKEHILHKWGFIVLYSKK